MKTKIKILILVSLLFSTLSTSANFSDYYSVKITDTEMKQNIEDDKDTIKEIFNYMNEYHNNEEIISLFKAYLSSNYGIQVINKVFTILTDEEKLYCDYLYHSWRGTSTERNKCEREFKNIEKADLEYKRSIGLTY